LFIFINQRYKSIDENRKIFLEAKVPGMAKNARVPLRRLEVRIPAQAQFVSNEKMMKIGKWDS
jgi:hypothetical protein